MLLHTFTDMERPDHNFMNVIEWRFGQVLNGMHMYNANICKMIDERYGSLEQKIRQFSNEVGTLKQCSEQSQQDILDLQEDREIMMERLERMEQKLDSMEMETKRSNLKFIGVQEVRQSDDYSSAEQITDILNECSHSPSWKVTDINRAFRVGRPRQRNDSPRPLIVQFFSWRDKMAVLNDRGLRDELRRMGIKVTSDLTTRQRDTLNFYWNQGQTPYYRNGKLEFANQRYPGQRAHQNISEDGNYFSHGERDWPQLPRHKRDDDRNRGRRHDRSPRRTNEYRRGDDRRRDEDSDSECGQQSEDYSDPLRYREGRYHKQRRNEREEDERNQSSQQKYQQLYIQSSNVSAWGDRRVWMREQRGTIGSSNISRQGNRDSSPKAGFSSAYRANPPVVPGSRSYNEVAAAEASSSAAMRRSSGSKARDSKHSTQQVQDHQEARSSGNNNVATKASTRHDVIVEVEHSVTNELSDAGTQNDSEEIADQDDAVTGATDSERETETQQDMVQAGQSEDHEDNQLTTPPVENEGNDRGSAEDCVDSVGRETPRGETGSASRPAVQDSEPASSQERDRQQTTGVTKTGPGQEDRDSRPTARSLRPRRDDAQKGRSTSQSSIVDSFQRMKSGERSKDSQTRRETTQSRSASITTR